MAQPRAQADRLWICGCVVCVAQLVPAKYVQVSGVSIILLCHRLVAKARGSRAYQVLALFEEETFQQRGRVAAWHRYPDGTWRFVIPTIAKAKGAGKQRKNAKVAFGRGSQDSRGVPMAPPAQAGPLQAFKWRRATARQWFAVRATRPYRYR